MRCTLLLLTGLSLSAAPTPIVWAQPAPPPRQIANDPFRDHITEASQRFGVPAAWIRAVMRAESAGDPRAISSAGAIGLMQIMPETWADLRARHRLGQDPYDPHDNILAGTAYLRELHDRYGGVSAMLAAYNAGPGRYEAFLSGRPLPAETRAYITTVSQAIDGNVAVSPVIVATTDPLSWTRAPLFVSRPDRNDAAEPLPETRKDHDAAMTIAANDTPAPSPMSGALFVSRSSSREGR